MTATTTELSIAFSEEELAALTELLRLHPVPGTDRARRWAPEELAAARRSLRARGVLGADDITMATAVADLLLIVTAPQVAIDISVSRPAGQPVTRRYALTSPAGIDQAEQDGVVRFTPFAAVEVLTRLADTTGLIGGPAVPDGRLPSDGITVPESVLRAVATEQDPQRRVAALLAAGLSAPSAAALAEVIATRLATAAVRVRRPVGPGRLEGMEAGWAMTDRGLVSWPVPAAGTDPWQDGDRLVTLRPVDVRELLADLATAVTGSPATGAVAALSAAGLPVDGHPAAGPAAGFPVDGR